MVAADVCKFPRKKRGNIYALFAAWYDSARARLAQDLTLKVLVLVSYGPSCMLPGVMPWRGSVYDGALDDLAQNVHHR